MPKDQTKRRLRSDFTLGGEQAEADVLLNRGFYESAYYNAIASRQDRRAFIVGRTGSGKSALLKHLEDEAPEHVIRIDPENLSLPYITNLGVVKYLSSIGVNLDPLFIALWKHVMLVEIIRHRYGINSPAAKQTILQSLMDRISHNPSKQLALGYFNEFDGKFWCEADERIRDIITRFEEQIDGEAKACLGIAHLASLGASLGSTTAVSTEIKSESVKRFQRIVNETQLPRMNKMLEILGEDILGSPQHYTYVVIDDLDRDWVDEAVANDLIRCLFRTVQDLLRVKHLKLLVALRTNIFEELDFGSRTGGQGEKFRALIITMRWTRGELEELLSQRVRAAAEQHAIPGLTSIEDLIPNYNNTMRSALDYIIDRTLMRPRDAIAYLNECLALASGKPRLTWDIIKSAERSYSHKRLLALQDEWRSSYPGIDKVLDKFQKAHVPMDQQGLRKILDEAILLMAPGNFEGQDWLERLSSRVWENEADWAKMYHPLFRLLFNMGFLGCRLSTSDSKIYSHDEPDFAEGVSGLSKVADFYIHPAFRPALNIQEYDERRSTGKSGWKKSHSRAL